jgi:adenosylcobinamide-GDP ribazoletransferase
LIVYVLLTRGLHMDGLADWADSIGGFGREKKLAIMKDVSMGAFGTLALILALMMRWAAFDRLISSDTFIWVMAVMTISRSMLVELTTTMPYARSGEGMAKPFVEKATGKQRLLSFVITLAVCFLTGPIGLGLYLAAWIITLLFKAYCRTNYGGITGDLLGAANEIIEIVLLALCALPGTYISGCMGWGWFTWM